MRVHVRFSLLALLVCAIVAVSAPAAAQAAFGVEKFVAINCQFGSEECGGETKTVSTVFGPQTYSIPKEPTLKEAEEEGFTVAGGRVPYGITDFKVTTKGELPNQVPEGVVKHIRTDVAPGLATSPAAVPQCSAEAFGNKEAVPGTGFYAASTCSSTTEIGFNQVTAYAGPEAGDLALEGTVYNLVQSETQKARAADYGVALKLPIPVTAGALAKAFAEKGHPLGKPTEEFLEAQQYYAHTIIEGGVEWGQEAIGTNKGDYHDYFEIEVSTALPLISSRLVFEGTSGNGAFITNATSCPGNNTTRLSLTGAESATVMKSFTTPIGLTGCNLVPFNPSLSLTPGATGPDQPNGFTTEVGIPHEPTKTDDSQLKTAVIKMPEGMTLNASAAAGLTACTENQARIHSAIAGTECPTSSELGTVKLDVPTLPPGSLTGKLYLGGPNTGAIKGPPYIVYLDAESARYGVSVRIKGEVVPNEATGQLTTTFGENPEQPFTKATLQFKGGALAPIANPLTCGPATTQGTFTPYTLTANKVLTSAFTVTGCSTPIPFSPEQGTAGQTATAGAATGYTVNLNRAEGQQYLSHVQTTLPPGLVGEIPKVAQCPEANANAGTCEAASAIGTANVASGSGSEPFHLSGTAYLTGPYNGAPYGMAIEVPVVAGPFDLGTSVTRLGIYVDKTTARVTVAGYLPSIVHGGVPTRLRQASVTINRPGFLKNPTNCQAEATESTVTGSLGASVNLSSPFQVANCAALAFKPKFKATTSARFSKKFGASLETTINQPAGQANIKSVTVQLPKQLPSRLTTLQKACPQATFEANPLTCPSGSLVGGARANTPTLPGKLSGPAYLVSHAGAAFPDLDLVLQANGVRVILVGNTDIKNSITTTKFAAAPDVAVSSITVNLPLGEHSALAAFGNLCAQALVMPTTIVAQNGTTVKQNTLVTPTGCGVRIVGHKVIGNTAYLTVATPAAGRISGSGSGLATVSRHVGSAVQATTLKVPLSSRGRGRGRPFSVRLRVGFVPSQRSRGISSATVAVTFR